MQITPTKLTIQTLLSPENEQLIIPSYQRRYAWGDQQVLSLFEDIDMLRPEKGDGHFLGMIIVNIISNSGYVRQMEIIDGQQRLTTISLLLLAMRDKYESFGAGEKVRNLERLLYCLDGQDNRMNKLILGELDNIDLENILKKDFEDVHNKKLLSAYKKFKSKLTNQGGLEWLNKFERKLLQIAVVIRLDIPSAHDAYRLFETINNRGLNLSATDIIKNFILGHAAKIDEGRLEEVKKVWTKIITNLDDINTDTFFRQYTCGLYKRKITSSQLLKNFKNHYLRNVAEVDKLGEYAYYSDMYGPDYTDDEEKVAIKIDLNNGEVNKTKLKDDRVDILDYLKDILRAATCYRKLIFCSYEDQQLNKLLRDLKDIESFTTYIYLMFYLDQDRPIKEKHKVVNLIGTVMLRRHICKERTAMNENIFANLLKVEIDDNYVQSLKDALLRNCPDDERFKYNFAQFEFKNALIKRAKYCLKEIEYYKTGNTGELEINSGEYVHLEHIIPMKIKTNKSKQEFGDWESYLGDNAAVKHKDFVHRIGNMTLLAGQLNISASNNPYESKQNNYNQSNISITQSLCKYYKEFKFDDVASRSDQLAALATEIWNIA